MTLATVGGDEDAAFALLRSTVEQLAKKAPPHLSGLKTQVRKQQPDFSEKRFGYGGFLQFVKAAQNRGLRRDGARRRRRRLHRPTGSDRPGRLIAV